MSLQHNGGCEPSKFDSELERQLPHLLLSWETLSGDCKKVMSRTTRVDIKIHFRAFSAFSASVKFLPFVWLELEIHPRAIKIEFPLKICKQIWKLDWEKICSKILYGVMEQLSFLCLLRCPFIIAKTIYIIYFCPGSKFSFWRGGQLKLRTVCHKVCPGIRV